MERVPPSEPGVDDADDDGEEECPIRCVVLVDGGGKNQKTKCLWWMVRGKKGKECSPWVTLYATRSLPHSWLISDLALLNEGVSAGAAAAAAMMMDPYQ